jgi:two-component system, NtrC family, response regulator AtoC
VSGGPRGAVLVVDDEVYVRESLAAILTRKGFSVEAVAGADEALEDERLEGIDVVVMDLKMPGVDGLVLLQRLAERRPNLPVVVLTAHGTIYSAVACVKAGAFEYLQKPANPDELVLHLDRAIRQSGLRRELDYLRSDASEPGNRRPLGQSGGWQSVLGMVARVAPSDTAVLIQGESGTGKEEVAQLIHAQSARAKGPFVRVNCAAVPTELFESEFFGHRKGAFSGASSDRDGRFRVAHRGTLFLDEINAMPETAQAKVLRVLEAGVFERVGESHPTRVDVRLLCATNVDLEKQVEAGRFRNDLFYRVNVVTIVVPPLRQRAEDIPILARAFLREMSARCGRRISCVSPEAMELLMAYGWPGNVRELRNVIERGVLLEVSEQLTVSSLPWSLVERSHPVAHTLRAALAAEERRLILAALERASGVRREAARILGIDERNLPHFLRKHGITAARPRRRKAPKSGGEQRRQDVKRTWPS